MNKAVVDSSETDVAQVQRIEIARIKPSMLDPRGEFADESVRDLAQSIDEDGLIQPMIVRPTDDPDYGYEVVCGHRRLRALQLIDRETAECIVRELSDRETLLFMLRENIQRQALNPICMANGYRQLKGEMGMTQIEIAEEVGVSQGTVSNKLQLLKLHRELQDAVLHDKLSVTRAYIYAKLAPDEQLSVYEDTRKVATEDLHYCIETKLGIGSFDMPDDVDAEKLADELSDGQETFDNAEHDVKLGLQRLYEGFGDLKSCLRRQAEYSSKHRDSLTLLFRLRRDRLVDRLGEVEAHLKTLLGLVRLRESRKPRAAIARADWRRGRLNASVVNADNPSYDSLQPASHHWTHAPQLVWTDSAVWLQRDLLDYVVTAEIRMVLHTPELAWG
ncbi:MAG: ParB/RepB/Spo0J family partition protein [Armatimonadota bacterium]